MHQYKIIARFLLIFPIINFAFALPIEIHQVRGDVVPRADVAITMLAKRGGEIGEQGVLKGPLTKAPDQGSMDPPQVDTSEIQQVSSAGPELSKSPSEGSEGSLKHYLDSPDSEASLNHYLDSSGSEASLNHFLDSPGSEASLNHYVDSPGSKVSLNHPPLSSPQHDTSFTSSEDSGYKQDAESDTESIEPETPKPKSKSLLKSLVSKLRKVKFWRRISGTGSTGIRDAVNTAQRDLQGLVDTGTTIVRDIGKSLNVLPTPPTRGVRRPPAGKPP